MFKSTINSEDLPRPRPSITRGRDPSGKERLNMSPTNKGQCIEEEPTDKVSFYAAWCKRCGICVAFCPRDALAEDKRGCPYLANPDRCTACRLCEMLCPDFAISVGERSPRRVVERAAELASRDAALPHARTSPERLAAAPPDTENDHG